MISNKAIAYMSRKLILLFMIISLSFIISPPTSALEKLYLSAQSGSPLVLPISEILRQAYQSIGIELKVSAYPGERSLLYSNSGITDGELFGDKEIEEKNLNLIRVNVPLREAHIYLFAKEANVFNVNGWQSIPKDYIVGYIRGVKFAEKALNENNITGDPSNDTDQLFLMLDKDRTKVVVSSKKRGMKYTSDSLSMGIVVLEPSVYTANIFHYLHKKNEYLLPEITQALLDMEESGRIDEIFQQVRKAKQ